MSHAQPLELLKQARSHFTQREIAERVGKNAKTVGCWEKDVTPCPTILEPALRNMRQTPNLWAYLQAYAEKHHAAGNGFGFGMAFPNSVTRTLSVRYHKDGPEILVNQGKKHPRRLTPRECSRLMDFPDTFRFR